MNQIIPISEFRKEVSATTQRRRGAKYYNRAHIVRAEFMNGHVLIEIVETGKQRGVRTHLSMTVVGVSMLMSNAVTKTVEELEWHRKRHAAEAGE